MIKPEMIFESGFDGEWRMLTMTLEVTFRMRRTNGMSVHSDSSQILGQKTQDTKQNTAQATNASSEKYHIGHCLVMHAFDHKQDQKDL